MFKSSVALSLCVLLSLALGATAFGRTYEKLLDFIDNIRVGEQYNQFSAHCFEGTTAYFVVRGVETVITPEWESQITKVENIDGTPVTTLLVSHAQWKVFTHSADPADMISPGSRIAVAGDYLQFLDVVTESIYRVDTTTGALSLFISSNGIAAVTGNARVRLLKETDFSSCGDMVFYDQESDRIMQVDVNGNLSTLVDDTALTAFYGFKPINHVAGGMAYDRAGNLYWTLTHGNTTGSAGGSIYKRQASDGSLSLVVPESLIQQVTNDGANVAFNDLYVAPDGNVYFYDRVGTVDSILYFDPGQPVTTNSLKIFLTEAEVKAGPAGPNEVNIQSFNSLGAKLTWEHVDNWYDLYAVTLAGTPLSPSDFDGDGDVDLTDYAHLAGCIAGPNQAPASPGCCSADLDQDRDVDLADFAWFQTEFQ